MIYLLLIFTVVFLVALDLWLFVKAGTLDADQAWGTPGYVTSTANTLLTTTSTLLGTGVSALGGNTTAIETWEAFVQSWAKYFGRPSGCHATRRAAT